MTKIEEMIKGKENEKFVFRPDREFYITVGIRQKRWGQIYRGEVAPTTEELSQIAGFFKVDLVSLLDLKP